VSVTPTEIESYLRQTQFAQTIKALRKDFPDMIRHWRKLSIDLVPVRLGSVTALFVDLHLLERVPEPTHFQRAKAHEIRDMLAAMGLMGDRKYKGLAYKR